MVPDIFPDAVVVYGYDNSTGYIRIAEGEGLMPGRGYWILLNEDKGYPITGQSIQEYTIDVNENGWYMIGGCSSPAMVSVENGTIEVIYRYLPGDGYQRLLESEDLEPGKGYWMLLRNIVNQATIKVVEKNTSITGAIICRPVNEYTPPLLTVARDSWALLMIRAISSKSASHIITYQMN